MRAAYRPRAAAIMVGAFLVTGCAQPPPQLDAETQWNDAMKNLGMFGIYPPSEDVMVGDTFLYVPNAPYFNLVRITSAPGAELAEQFCWQEGDRLALDTPPPTQRPEEKDASGTLRRDASVPAGLRGNVVCPEHDRDRAERAPRRALRQVAPYNASEAHLANRLTRLREAAIPTLEVGRFSQTQVAGGITSGNIGLALGLGGSSASAVRVSLDDLQSATLEEVRGFRLIELIQLHRLLAHLEHEARIPESQRRAIRDPNALTPLMLARTRWHADNRAGSDLLPKLCGGDFDGLLASRARIMVANRVLYAGGVSFDFLSEDVFATRFALEFASALANARQNPRVLDLPGAATGSQPPPPPRNQATPPPQDAAALDRELSRLAGFANDLLTLPAGGPGQASGRITVGRFGNLALRRDFVRPAAVGMGAALHFPIHEAAVPVNSEQIDDVVMFCNTVGAGTADNNARLRQQLEANRAWIAHLYRRTGWMPALPLPDPTQPTPQPPATRTRMPPLTPTANIRVGL